MKNIVVILLLFVLNANAQQYKSFQLLENGDTLNRLDNNNMKQGKWKIHINALRLEPAYDEEGTFINDKKEGVWRKYDMYGLMLAKEFYKWGNKYGLQQYLYQGQLEREENWITFDPKKKFDTIEVPDLYNEYRVEKKIVKVDNYSLQHGTWTYYDPETGRVIKTVEYSLGQLVPAKKELVATAPVDTVPKPKVKPKAVLEFEKNNKGKKKISVRDGGTGY